jgi:hypothetical protein
MMDEERMEAAERASRYYERQGCDEPDHNSGEWRDTFNYYYDKVRDGD